MRETYDAVAAWPLYRTLAANDLIDAYDQASDEAYAQAEAERRPREGAR